jgi:hypothetical protein
MVTSFSSNLRKRRKSGFYKSTSDQEAAARRTADSKLKASSQGAAATPSTTAAPVAGERPVQTLADKGVTTPPTEKTGFAIEGTLGEKFGAGIQNVKDVFGAIKNKEGLEANLGDGIIEAFVEDAAEHPFRTALFVAIDRAGVIGKTWGAGKRVLSKATKISQIGKFNTGGSITKFATTPKSLEGSRHWLQRLYTTEVQKTTTNLATGVSTTISKVSQSTPANSLKIAATSAGNIISMIGSYPFSGFLIEEALQDVSRGANEASEQGLYDLADELYAETDAMLNAEVEKGILERLPYINSIRAVAKYFRGARIKNEVSKMISADRRWLVENNQDPASLQRARDQEWEDRKAADIKKMG